jgi:hypothetical protein
MVSSIIQIQSALNSPINHILISHIFELCHIFEGSTFAVFMLWFCASFWWQDINIYVVSSVFTSRPTSLLAPVRDSVFFFMVYMLLSNRFTSSVETEADVCYSISVPPGFLDLPNSYSKAKFKHLLVSVGFFCSLSTDWWNYVFGWPESWSWPRTHVFVSL